MIKTKVAFLNSRLFLRLSEPFENFSVCSNRLDKSHFCFDHVNRQLSRVRIETRLNWSCQIKILGNFICDFLASQQPGWYRKKQAHYTILFVQGCWVEWCRRPQVFQKCSTFFESYFWWIMTLWKVSCNWNKNWICGFQMKFFWSTKAKFAYFHLFWLNNVK